MPKTSSCLKRQHHQQNTCETIETCQKRILAKITNIFRYINTTLWSKAGHFNKALSKGAKTTTWIWNLHDYAHDFDIQQRSTGLIARKVFSSNLAHLSLVFFWISGMHLHGAYLSNYDIWLKDPKSIITSSLLFNWSRYS